MIIPKVAVCPICGKKTYLRIQDGGYLNEYPIRVYCMNCRALIKGTYIMDSRSPYRGLHLWNADVEECETDGKSQKIFNADYVVEISGELPCNKVHIFDGNFIYTSPYLDASDNVDILERKERLSGFASSMREWARSKSIAFQLLDEGSIEYIATALKNKMGEYDYQCDHYLKSLRCLQEVVLEETKYLFVEPEQDILILELLKELSQVEYASLHRLIERMGGVSGLILAYRKAIEVFSDFMRIYPNLLPAETYMRFKDKSRNDVGIATCSFGDIKTFYQDAYESLLSLLYVPVCLDNIIVRGDYKIFNENFEKLFKQKRFTDLEDDFMRYQVLDNGMKLNKIQTAEIMQKTIEIPANKFLRNGIGHNNIKYDGITQKVSAFSQKEHNKAVFETSLMDMSVECIGLAKSSVLIAEILLFMISKELRQEGVHSIMHPRFYVNAEPNSKCPCGSNYKYKKCCRLDVERITRC